MINYALIGEALLHPTKKAILAVFDRSDSMQCWSPNGLATELDMPLGNVSYHVNDLAGRGKHSRFVDRPVLILESTEPRRGALEHFFTLAPGVRV
jgi:hypothetical protein